MFLRFPYRVSPYALAVGLCLTADVALAFSISNLEYWVGSGSNRAALVVDWHDESRPHALAWGYRWDGQARGLDMWQAVTARTR